MSKPLGINLTVDFAFKKTFGSPENIAALIGLLNAILELDNAIIAAEIVNPFNYQEFATGKQIVLDVRCRDSTGRSINVEMQVAVIAGLTERLVYYVSSMCVDQLGKGDSYTQLNPSISVCLLRQVLFADSGQPHHRFQLIDRKSGRLLNDAIEVHTIELTKYNLSIETIRHASRIEQWVFLLLYAQDLDAETLRRLLPGIEFETAIVSLETISAKTEDKAMYDQREKAMRDYQWAISSARDEGIEQGIEQGKEKGRAEGIELGLLTGRIQLLQELLGESPECTKSLGALTYEELSSRAADLQQRLRDRSK